LRLNSRGFNLIELMVVVAVLGVIFSIAIPNYYAMKARALEANVQANMYNFEIAIIHFAVDNKGIYPTPADDAAILVGMPGNLYPENPFTDVREPWVWGPAGGPPGTIGSSPPAGGYTVGFVIWGIGRAGAFPLVLRSD
jgi:general secretion pathway protein G